MEIFNILYKKTYINTYTPVHLARARKMLHPKKYEEN